MKRTRNPTFVYDYLEAHGKPASAYDILDAPRNDRLRVASLQKTGERDFRNLPRLCRRQPLDSDIQ